MPSFAIHSFFRCLNVDHRTHDNVDRLCDRAETSYFSFLLFKGRGFHQPVAVQLWAAAFGCVAIAAVLGGTCHGFPQVLGEEAIGTLWQLLLYVLSFASCLMLSSSLKSSIPRRWQTWGWLLVGSKSFIYLSWMGTRPSTQDAFTYGVVDYLSAMLIVFVLEARATLYLNTAGARWILLGILISAVAIALQTSGVKFAEYFNHNDLYHLVQMVAFYYFYQGATLTKDQ
ncbi:MAG: hypothetical protein HC772_04175 [Leptolyngbyaceae cyanobacterium CRU_2_3]|nr:hypothetical protein [Leptolyngbyaceae cyanobacterium CRU_2_3]